MNELNGKFQTIVNDLINRFQNLVCYVPRGYKGKVRWVLKCEEPKPIIKPTTKRRGIGVISGNINGMTLKRYSRKFAFQFDCGLKSYYYYYAWSKITGFGFYNNANFMYENNFGRSSLYYL